MTELPIDPECDLPDGRRASYLASLPSVQQRANEASELLVAAGVASPGCGLTDPESWPLSYAENVGMMTEVSLDLHDAGYIHHRGGGFDENDAIRELIRFRDRMDKIAQMHSKHVGPSGLTSGCCNECGHIWPCPTYDWARRTSDRDPSLSCWDRDDDDPAAPSGEQRQGDER